MKLIPILLILMTISSINGSPLHLDDFFEEENKSEAESSIY